MKLIIVITILTFSFLNCKAQSPIVTIDSDEYSENIYRRDINGVFNPFIGTWTWQDGNSSIEIELIKVEQVYYEVNNRKVYTDELIGRIKYIENGVEIFNTLNNSDDNYTFVNISLPISNGISLRYKDPLLSNKRGHIDFDLINNGTQATFRLRNTSGVRFKPEDLNEDPEFSMPRRLVFTLTKQ